MSVVNDVCEAWLLELQDVSGLEDATTHKLASWSSAAMADTTPGRHLAVWPEAEPFVVGRATTDGGDQITTNYVIAVWEGATAEATRVFDDDGANEDWVALYEAVQDRLYLRANLAIGDTGSDIHYEGGAFSITGDRREFAIRFSKRRYKLMT